MLVNKVCGVLLDLPVVEKVVQGHLDHKDNAVIPVQWDLKDWTVFQAILEVEDLQDLLEERVYPDNLEMKELPAKKDRKAKKEV